MRVGSKLLEGSPPVSILSVILSPIAGLLTNTCSLMALIATTVFHYKTTGQVPASTAFAFTCIRVQLFMDAHADEIMVLPL